MCGRFTQKLGSSEIARIFDAEDLAEDLGERYNVAPTDEAVVVVERAGEEGVRRAAARYRWGLVPHWASDRRIGSRTFNARAETIARSPAFRDAFRRRRCLVPVDGFYEWVGTGRARQPLRIHDPSGRPLALAGLWAGRRDPETDLVERTFTIVTSAPSAFMASIHDRMPVVIPPDAWARWLDPVAPDLAELGALLEPRDDIALVAHPVSRLVNDVRNDGPALIEPASPSGPPDPPEPLVLPLG